MHLAQRSRSRECKSKTDIQTTETQAQNHVHWKGVINGECSTRVLLGLSQQHANVFLLQCIFSMLSFTVVFVGTTHVPPSVNSHKWNQAVFGVHVCACVCVRVCVCACALVACACNEDSTNFH